MHAHIAVLAGDGIGPEVVSEAVRVLKGVAAQFAHRFSFSHALIGGCAIDALGAPLPADTLALCRKANAILLGAVGGPQWSSTEQLLRPERGLLELRQTLGLFANLRPVSAHADLLATSPLRPEVVRGVDLMVVRELTGGIYFGHKERTANDATDVCRYSVTEIERVVRLAAGLARSRRRQLTSIDKSNVLETSRLWRSVVERLMPVEFPEVEVRHMLVDSAAMHLIKTPRDFDVIVTENMFGDILTDEAAVLAGSLGLLPSASIGEDGSTGLYEPIHGSAPDIAGRGIANPYGTILSAALLLRHSLRLETEARAVEQAVQQAIAGGFRTADIAAGGAGCTTREAADAVIAALSLAPNRAPGAARR